ncbi:MAG: hypothetical protein M1828_002360 [Chrysothrix sp. TS-e1954]|nr:MAG: hypothetical protein M1828_002360 [Chrysothrix sp. TS-e1954]
MASHKHPAEEVVELIEELNEDRGVFVARLSEPLLAPLYNAHHPNSASARNSDASASTDGQERPTPASLEADLMHYKDLFTKLRFSYTSQVTKERFLRSIIASPIVKISDSDNATLEARLADSKAELQQQKAVVAQVLSDLEVRTRTCAERYQRCQDRLEQLRAVPDENAKRRGQISQLQARLDELTNQDARPGFGMPLPATLDRLEEQKRKLAAMEDELRESHPVQRSKRKVLEEIEAEARYQQERRDEAVQAAEIAKGRRDEGIGGLEDEVEERGRWLTAWEATLKEMMPVNRTQQEIIVQ